MYAEMSFGVVGEVDWRMTFNGGMGSPKGNKQFIWWEELNSAM